jgi:hypothetical protein
VKHIKLFESYPSSHWPRKKTYRGVKVLNVLDYRIPGDSQRIKDYLKLAYDRNGWFKSYFDSNNQLIPGSENFGGTEFAEVLMPTGRREILAFDDFDGTNSDEQGFGYISAESLDGKWSFWVDATSDGDVEWDSLDFDKNKLVGNRPRIQG